MSQKNIPCRGPGGSRLKRSTDPKCSDYEEQGCRWYPKKGCYKEGATFEDKPKKKSTKSSKKSNKKLTQQSMNQDEEAAMLLTYMKNSTPAKQRYAKIFVAEWDFDFSYPNFPIETVYVKNKDDILDECYAPEWIYRKDTRTNHIKCMSDDEHRRLATEYYKRMDLEKKQEFERFTADIVMKIIFNGGSPGDLVENKNETGYRTSGLYVLDYNNEGNLVISKLNTDLNEYGSIPPNFSLNEQFKPGYWTHAFERGEVISVIDDGSLGDGANWYDAEEHAEPLHISKLKGLRKSKLSSLSDSIQIDLGFMKLIYYGDKSVDALYQAIKSKDIMSIFQGIDNALYVQPLTSNQSLIIEV